MRDWLKWHSLWHHVLAPVWLRLPERARWRVVDWLNRSPKRCWSTLVDDALARPEEDACDVSVPALRGSSNLACASRCDWLHPDHVGRHDCDCYCGKFKFTAPEGALERRAS